MKLKITCCMMLTVMSTLSSIGQSAGVIADIDQKLRSRKTTISRILADTSFMYLHSLTAFREIIQQNARAENIQLTTYTEPGVKISVTGVLLDESKISLVNKLVYVYQTSSVGWYSDTAPHILKNEGDRNHARIFGYFKTDDAGKFSFSTIKPNGYPRSDLPAHIHIEITLSNSKKFISELLFDDDPRLMGDIRAGAMRAHFYISKNSGSLREPVYDYTIQTNN